VDGSHPHAYVDRNRCILCGRCVRSSREKDHKNVFGFEGRGINMRLAVDSKGGLSRTELSSADKAASYCPTGSLVVKRVGWKVPVGKRLYDARPIGSEIEGRRK
jgi:[NiFe] hydrogenase diaphorase moiety small subunit